MAGKPPLATDVKSLPVTCQLNNALYILLVTDIMLYQMHSVSTREAARRLGISLISLQRYIAAKKIKVPKLQKIGGIRIRLWTPQDISRVRKELPGINNGRRKQKKS